MVIPISKIISCLTFLPTYEQELDVKVPLEEWLSYSNATGEQHCCLCLDDIILNPLKGRPSLLPQLLEKNMTFKDNSGISHESREVSDARIKKTTQHVRHELISADSFLKKKLYLVAVAHNLEFHLLHSNLA